jgi:hypothetical protein
MRPDNTARKSVALFGYHLHLATAQGAGDLSFQMYQIVSAQTLSFRHKNLLNYSRQGKYAMAGICSQAG